MTSDKLPNGWYMATLAEIASQDGYGLVDGPFGSNLPASAYVPSGIPVIRGSNLSLGDTRFRDDAFVFVSDETAKRLSRSLCSINDIIFTKKGTLGQIGIIPAQSRYPMFLLSSNQMKLSVDQKIANPQFVYYQLSSPASRAKIIQDSEATGVPKTNLAYLRTFPILLPPLYEQHSIARILGTLDDKIELNRRMNNTLEGIAQALFKSWFVDFDPVKAKAEGRKPEGIDDATASLFPSAFTESTLGPIPEGWEISSLGDFIELAYGKALKANGRNEGFVPVYGSNGQIGWHDTALVKGPSIVVGRKGNPGTIIYVHEDFFPIDTTFFVVPSQRVPSIIFLRMLMERLGLPSLSADSAVPGLNRNAAYSARCILPPLNLIENFNKLITPFILKEENLKNENKRLIDIRDLLLPRLISGKLRVDEVSEIMEAVTS